MVQPNPDTNPTPRARSHITGARAKKMDVDRHVGAMLAAKREERGISLKNFARRIGLPTARLRMFETGSASMPASLLLQVGNELSVSVSHFFAGLRRQDDQMRGTVAAQGVESEELSRAFLTIDSLSVRKRI